MLYIQTISSWLFFSTNFIYGAGAASFALLMSCIFHTPGAATKGTIVIWLVTIGGLQLRILVFFFVVLIFKGDENYFAVPVLFVSLFYRFYSQIFAVLTRLQVTDGSVLLNIILSLNLNYAFICAHRAMQDYMNRGNCLFLDFYKIPTNLDLLYV